MYQYYKGFIVREGNEGIPAKLLRELYLSVSWINEDMPEWLNEKFGIALQNSAWAFSVWDKDKLIGLVRVISDKVMIATIEDLIIHPDYQGKGLGSKLVELCKNKLPHGSWFASTTPNNYVFYQKQGFIIQENDRTATLIFNGFKQAQKEGHR